jgi:hypothetical protein
MTSKEEIDKYFKERLQEVFKQIDYGFAYPITQNHKYNLSAKELLDYCKNK